MTMLPDAALSPQLDPPPPPPPSKAGSAAKASTSTKAPRAGQDQTPDDDAEGDEVPSYYPTMGMRGPERSPLMVGDEDMMPGKKGGASGSGTGERSFTELGFPIFLYTGTETGTHNLDNSILL